MKAVVFTLIIALAALPAGAANLSTTTAFIAAGGGAGRGSFSSVRAFDAAIGTGPLQAEITKLRATLGGRDVDTFFQLLDYTFNDGWERAGQDDVRMPEPGLQTGTALALDLVKAGTDVHQTFRTSTMLDNLLTPRVHAQVDADIISRYGTGRATALARVGDRFFVDLARSLGDVGVNLPGQ